MSLPEAITWNISKNNTINAVYFSCKKMGYSVDRVQMNKRNTTESVDDKIMGDIATVSVFEYLISQGIPAIMYDQIREDDFKEIDSGWDIAFGPNLSEWISNLADPTKPEGLLTMSIKSSRLPKYDTLEKAISIRDFKIFAYPGKEIEECITADIECQVYYDYYKTQLGSRQINNQDIIESTLDKENAIKIINSLEINLRYGESYLTAWNFKENIVEESKSIQRRYWDSFGKRMWIAPLKNGKNLEDLKKIQY